MIIGYCYGQQLVGVLIDDPALWCHEHERAIKSSHEEQQCQSPDLAVNKKGDHLQILPVAKLNSVAQLSIIQWMCDETFSTDDDPMPL